MARDIRDGNGDHIRTIDPTTGKKVVMFYEPVRSGVFSFVLVVPEKEMFAGVNDLHRQLMSISAVAIVFMGCVAFVVSNSMTRPINRIVEDFQDISEEAFKGKLTSRANADVEIDFKKKGAVQAFQAA